MTGDTGIHEQVSGDSPVRTLAIVSNELMETIRNAALALEDCVDGRGGTAALKRAGELLHQARGALQITETYGAALLVEEETRGLVGDRYSDGASVRALPTLVAEGVAENARLQSRHECRFLLVR